MPVNRLNSATGKMEENYVIKVDGVEHFVTRMEYDKHVTALLNNEIDKLLEEDSEKLTEEEIKTLWEAKKANSKYFDALLERAKIIPQRVGKYSGEEDPYTNFKIMKYELGLYFQRKYGIDIDMRDVFMFYHVLKHARMLVSGSKDFADDSAADSRRDGLNYLAIDLGDMLDASTD